MKSIFSALTLIAVIICGNRCAKAQSFDTLVYHSTYTIPFNTIYNNEPIEELSGIEYTGNNSQYYLIPQSRNKSHFFLYSIYVLDDSMYVKIDSVLYLDHGPLEAESIRINPKNKQIYIAEEGNGYSHIYRLNDENKLDTVYSSALPQKTNSGYEGLCFNTTGTKMYISLERPKNAIASQIIVCDLENNNEVIYDYFLDDLPLDRNKDNGITELLYIDDSTLLVVERAFLGAKHGMSVRVYKVRIPSNREVIKKIKLLTNFSGIPAIDNIEGVTYSASGKELIFISDNNANHHQQTLFICMKIE